MPKPKLNLTLIVTVIELTKNVQNSLDLDGPVLYILYVKLVGLLAYNNNNSLLTLL